MKLKVFILAIFALITYSLSAQSKQYPKSDSIKIGFNSYQQILNDTLKLSVPSESENRQFLFPKNELQNQNLAQFDAQRSIISDPQFRMPILKPGFKSEMPVMRPDSSVHFFLRIKKIGK